MIAAVLVVTALSLVVVLLAAHIARRWIGDTITALERTQRELRPALLRVRDDAQRSAQLRAALMADRGETRR